MRWASEIIVALLFVALASTQVYAQQAWLPDVDPNEPAVYALVIACGYKANRGDGWRPLDQALPAAEEFVASLASQYGPSLRLAMLWDDAEAATGTGLPTTGLRPTLSVVQRYLAGQLPKLPQGSLLIVYFIGHGERPPVNRYVDEPGDLLLLLEGSRGNLQHAPGHSIRALDIADAAARTHRCITMVLLDCCHSGPSNGEDNHSSVVALEHRGLMLGATMSSDVAFSGTLTDSFVTWLASADGGGSGMCQTPDALLDALVESYQDEGLGHEPQLWYGQTFKQCFLSAGSSDTLLVFVFPEGIRKFGGIQVTLDDEKLRPIGFDLSRTPDRTGRRSAIGVVVPSDRRVEVNFLSSGGLQMWSRAFELGSLQATEMMLLAVVPEEKRYLSLDTEIADFGDAALELATRKGLAADQAVFEISPVLADANGGTMPESWIRTVRSVSTAGVFADAVNSAEWNVTELVLAPDDNGFDTVVARAASTHAVIPEQQFRRFAVALQQRPDDLALLMAASRLERSQLERLQEYAIDVGVHELSRRIVSVTAATRPDLSAELPSYVLIGAQEAVERSDVVQITSWSEMIEGGLEPAGARFYFTEEQLRLNQAKIEALKVYLVEQKEKAQISPP